MSIACVPQGPIRHKCTVACFKHHQPRANILFYNKQCVPRGEPPYPHTASRVLSGVVPCSQPSRLVCKAKEAIAVSQSRHGPPAFAYSVRSYVKSVDTHAHMPYAHMP